MSDRARAVALALSSTVMAAFGLAGHSRISGPLLFIVSYGHGLHLDDLFVIAGWVVALLVSRALWRRS